MAAWELPFYQQPVANQRPKWSHVKSMAIPVSTQTPTRVRYWVIVFAVTLAVITYIDRVCISQAAPLITEDLKLTKEQMGWVLFAFSLAYSVFEIPGGYL